jgi:purine-nucleoside phosphorylase
MTGSPVGVVSGSGIDLSALLDTVEERLPFESIPGLTAGQVPGHRYGFVRGHCGARPVILQQGRRHFYEGLDHAAVVRTVDALRSLGAETVIFTNVAGGLLPVMEPGDLVAVDRVIPWRYCAWPGQPRELRPDFLLPGCGHTGAYVWMHGPCYETRAEVGAVQTLGGAVVGMSTAPELARCLELGLQTAVVSCVTNVSHHTEVLTHEHVVSVARHASERLVALIRSALQNFIEN